MEFYKYKWINLGLASILLIISLISLILFPLKPSIDFTGGSLIELTKVQELNNQQIAQFFQEAINTNPQSIIDTADNHILVKVPQISQSQLDAVIQLANSPETRLEVLRFESIGPTLGKELLYKTLVASTCAALFIAGYIAWAFKKWTYGISAIVAMFHDTLIVLGVFSLLGKFGAVEIDTLFVTALLTTLSFSVHDTVVVFDRIRESLHRYPHLSLPVHANRAITQTLSRSFNNSITIIFMLLSLVLIGGSSIHYFALALLIGTISGTYSSPFVAVPLLIMMQLRNQSKDLKKKK